MRRNQSRIRRAAKGGQVLPMSYLELEKINNKLGAILLILTKLIREEK
jgi:hypothetical protein